MFLNWEKILIKLGQPADSSSAAQKYIMISLPGVLLNSQFEWLRRFLLVQGVYNPILYIMLMALLLHNAFLYISIFTLKLGIFGVAIATTITYSGSFIALSLYVHLKKDLINRESWHWFDRASIKEIPQLLKYGIPSLFMVINERYNIYYKKLIFESI